jgi:hypothetical protein
MTALKTISFVPCLLAMTAALASAQSRPASTAGLDHGYMTATAGAAFSDQRSATFGVEIAERMGSRAQAYIAFTYFDNLFNDRAAADLVTLESYLHAVTGLSYELSGRDRGLAFSGGAKYLISRGPTFRPYVGAAPGVLNIERTINDPYLGDVSDPVIGLYGAPDGVINASKQSSFKPMAEFIAGVGIAAGRTYVDIGYRYRKVFQTSEPFNFSQLTAGIGMRF